MPVLGPAVVAYHHSLLAGIVDSDAAVGPMLSSGDMPPGCKPDHWARLVALRDARLSLEVDAQQLTNTAQLLSAQLDVLQEEESGLVAKLGEAEQVFLHTQLLA